MPCGRPLLSPMYVPFYFSLLIKEIENSLDITNSQIKSAVLDTNLIYTWFFYG